MKNSTATPNAYDQVPYASYPFSQTNPSALRAAAALFGLAAPELKSARILELGCASGNNILAIASRYPESECVGIDLSKVQIEEGQKLVKKLGLKNLKLQQASILDIDKKFGKFDYIICHGVFSWVPAPVQKKILEICGNNLTQNGVAYVSYNTMPGWSAIQSLREMMLYHTARFTNPQQKAEQARLMLKFVRDSLGSDNKSTYAEIVESEMNILKNQSDWYLLHDHLEENNTQLYFHQFMEMAAAEGLQYLAEVSLSTMFSGNLPAETAKVLATSDDIVRTEQYLDFIYNRRFRSTLLCHKDRILRRNVTPEAIVNTYFTNNFNVPAEAAEYKLGSGQPLAFVSGSNVTLTTGDTLLIAAILALAEQKKKPINLKTICKLAVEKIKAAGLKIENEAKLPETLGVNMLRGIFCGGFGIFTDSGRFATSVPAKAKAYFVAQNQSATQDWVINLRQESVKINAFDRALLPLLDGKSDEKSLIKSLLPKFTKGELSMSDSGNQVTDAKILAQKLPEFLKNTMHNYANMALLEE